MQVKENLTKRLIMAVIGLILLGIGVGIIQFSNLGVDPFTAFVIAIGNLFNKSFGQMYPFINAALVIIVLLVDRKLIGISTVLNLILIGPFADITLDKITSSLPNPNQMTLILSFALGLLIMGLGISLYIRANLGGGPYDCIQLLMSKKIPKMTYKYARIICDITCVIIGFIGGATLGLGTVVNALLMGPIVAFFDKTVSASFYQRSEKK